MAKKVKAQEDDLFNLFVCTACGLPFTSDEWDQRHWGELLTDEYHEACCPQCNNEEVNDDVPFCGNS